MRISERETKDIAMLQKAVSLCQLKVAALRQGDLLNLKEDLFDLTGRSWMGNHKEEFLRQLTVKQIRTIQTNFRHRFESLAEGNKSVSWKIDTPMKLTFAVYWQKVDEPFEYGIMARDPVHAAEIALVVLLISSRVTPERFRKCPECRSLFLLLRKPDKRSFYCSQRCAGRAATRNFRRGKRESTKPKLKTPEGGSKKESVAHGGVKGKPGRIIELDSTD